MEKTYGILGGYGAPAGLHLHTEVINQTLAARGHADLAFPRFILTNLPYAVMTETGEVQDEEEFILANREAAEAFQLATDVLVLCNSFHRHLPIMKEIYGGKLINLPEQVGKEAAARGHKNPLLVSSIETIQAGLYLNENYTLSTYYNPVVIESGMKTETPQQELMEEILKEAQNVGADSIIMGCTDLNTYAKALRELTSLPIIDSVETAAKIIVEGN